jgi:pimeloyl-ACP methyl ester carboxylesterase
MPTRAREEYQIAPAQGGALAAYLSHPGSAGPWAVLYVHGFGSTRAGEKPTAVEEACARRGWTFASFDFRGHGASSGTLLELRPSGLLDDLAAVRQELHRRGIQRLALVGSSMGGWASLWFAQRHPDAVTACALIAPAVDFLRLQRAHLTEAEVDEWRRAGRRRVRNQWVDVEVGPGVLEEAPLFPADTLAPSWAKPLLIFHGMQDDTAPYAHSLAFVEAVPPGDVELRLFRAGDHRLLAYRDVMAEAACDLFARTAP